MRLVKDPAVIPSGALNDVHRGHPHFWQRALSPRRQFMGGTIAVTGAVAGSGLLSPILARADEGPVAPKPLT